MKGVPLVSRPGRLELKDTSPPCCVPGGGGSVGNASSLSLGFSNLALRRKGLQLLFFFTIPLSNSSLSISSELSGMVSSNGMCSGSSHSVRSWVTGRCSFPRPAGCVALPIALLIISFLFSGMASRASKPWLFVFPGSSACFSCASLMICAMCSWFLGETFVVFHLDPGASFLGRTGFCNFNQASSNAILSWTEKGLGGTFEELLAGLLEGGGTGERGSSMGKAEQ